MIESDRKSVLLITRNFPPMVGGMVSSTILTLVVIPVIYALVKRRELLGPRGRPAPDLSLPEGTS